MQNESPETTISIDIRRCNKFLLQDEWSRIEKERKKER